ncbi:MAG: hypothetical protein KKD73_06690 [Proteobacteria bacterium]|nr:hypothetical protein [Pseudomonadota bacterium]MBU1640034.1 hypothetical protein [Pseudomonadota bacterium]
MSLPLKHKKTDTSFWDKRRGVIHTKNGGLVIGEAVYSHGYDMMEDLVGQASYFQVMVLNVTGRLPERRLADWLEALFICLSYPDARIWCNQIGSLSGTLRATPVAAISSGILASDSRMYGPGVAQRGMEFIIQARLAQQEGITPEKIIDNYPRRHSEQPPRIPGYFRPVALGDERIAPMECLANHLGFKIGDHLALAYEIEKLMREIYHERMNLLGYCTAFLADQNFHACDIYRLLSIWVSSGINACYAEAADQPPESFFPLQCEDIDYQGKPRRPVPARN